MITNIKNKFLFTLLFIIAIVSCRTEDDLSIDPPDDANIQANSPLANLMSRVAMNDGSQDNVIDNASNLSVLLPVTVTVNGTVININSEDNYEDILDNFDESNDDDDNVIISYPITVVLSDYSTVLVNSDSQLDALTNNINDEDIECIDFEYPITIAVFNENTETAQTITITNDNQLYDFIEDLNEFTAITINFPITTILANGNEQTINSVTELENVIIGAIGTCDEDDDNDFNDCNANTYTSAYFEDSILACGEWTIDKLKRNNNNLVNLYEEYSFVFNVDGTVLVTENANSFNGTWSAAGPEGAVLVTIDIPGLPDFNDTWNLCKINLQPVEKQIELKIGTDRLRFGSYCSANTDADLEDILEDGIWIVASYTDDGEDETSDYNGYEINFNNGGNVFATNGNIINNGTWSVFANEGKLNLDFDSQIPFQEFNDNNWNVLSVSSTEVVIKDGNGGNGGTEILTLQKF